MDRLIIVIFLVSACALVFMMMFRGKSAKAAHAPANGEEGSSSRASREESSSAGTDMTSDGILGGIIAPSPMEKERASDLARPLTTPLETNSLFEKDKVDDLSRPYIGGDKSETDLFELDKENDLSRPL